MTNINMKLCKPLGLEQDYNPLATFQEIPVQVDIQVPDKL